jgi:hypothetical protein
MEGNAMVNVVSDVYTAYVGGEFVESRTTLAHLLAVLDEICDADGREDVAVWRGQQLVAVRLCDGRVLAVDALRGAGKGGAA